MKIQRAVALSAVLATALSLGPARAATDVTKDYLPPNGVYGMCDIEPIVPGVVDQPWGVNIGAVCAEVPGGTSEARIQEIVEPVFAQVGFLWYWFDENWVEVGGVGLTEDPEGHLLDDTENHGFGCYDGSPGNWFQKPAGAKYFYVFVDTPVFGALDCQPGDGGATVGSVTIRFR